MFPYLIVRVCKTSPLAQKWVDLHISTPPSRGDLALYADRSISIANEFFYFRLNELGQSVDSCHLLALGFDKAKNQGESLKKVRSVDIELTRKEKGIYENRVEVVGLDWIGRKDVEVSSEENSTLLLHFPHLFFVHSSSTLTTTPISSIFPFPISSTLKRAFSFSSSRVSFFS
ncbi:hypothetical protein Csa_006168 [Cucumis sativus]|uniref:Uncharacterized protein n=1 Tax=Cucumis sativus TaxID=3659 RepID=A0A0A0LKU7_CUCSA|nr:hypothetical protein Csa_006168 [Cucumis sativus]